MTSAVAAPPLAEATEFRSGMPTLALALAGIATSVTALLIYSLGTLIVPLEQALGWSRSELQLAVSFIAAGGAISVYFVGALNSRHGMRGVTSVSLLLVALGFGSLMLMEGSIAWLYLGCFLLPFVGMGTTPVTWTHIVSLHFERHRGLALSLALCGTGITAAALPPVMSWAIGRWGWQAGYAVLALLPLLMWLSMSWRRLPNRAAMQPAALARTAPRALRGMPFAAAVRSTRFWLLNLSLGLVVSAIYGLATNTVPMLRDIGLSAAAAGGVFSVFGVSLIIGRIAVGMLVDRYWAPWRFQPRAVRSSWVPTLRPHLCCCCWPRPCAASGRGPSSTSQPISWRVISACVTMGACSACTSASSPSARPWPPSPLLPCCARDAATTPC
jgi:MFS family permease